VRSDLNGVPVTYAAALTGAARHPEGGCLVPGLPPECADGRWVAALDPL